MAFSCLEGPSGPLDTTPPPQVTLLSCILLLAPYGNVKNVHCTVYSVLTVHCTLYGVLPVYLYGVLLVLHVHSLYTLCTVNSLYTVLCTVYQLYTVHCKLYSLYTVQCTHCTQYTVWFTHCSLYTVHCMV